MSRIASANTAYDPQNTLSQQASAPILVNEVAQPPPCYTSAQQQYPYPYPGQQYEMQPYPEYPQHPAAPGDPSTAPPYPGHGTYPQQYYPAVGDTSKYYPQPTEVERGTPEPRRSHLRSFTEVSKALKCPSRLLYNIIIVCWVSACASLGRGGVDSVYLRPCRYTWCIINLLLQ